jgi:hypothetical protein
VIRKAAGYNQEPPSPGAAALATAADKLASAADRLASSAAPPKPAEPEVVMSKQEQRQYEVFQKMGELDPKYKELAVNSKRFLAELPQATENWEKGFRLNWSNRHKESDYDSDRERETALNEALEEAREDFISKQKQKYGLDWDEADFDEAKEKLIEDRVRKPVEEKLSKAEKEIEDLRKGKVRQEVAPIAQETAEKAVADFATNIVQVDATLEGLIGADGKIDQAKADALPDPELVVPIIEDATSRARNFAEWTVRAFSGDQFDSVPRRAGMTEAQYQAALQHEQVKRDSVVDFTFMVEDEVAGLPADQQVDGEGRTFARMDAYSKMTPAERKNHWILTSEDVIARANDMILGGAKKAIDAERKRVEPLLKRHGIALGVPRGTAAPAAAAAPAPAKAPSAKPSSPTSTDGTPIGTPSPSSGSGFLASRFRAGNIVSGVGGQG